MKSMPVILTIVVGSLLGSTAVAQDRLYPNEFPLAKVRLLAGPFSDAQKRLNIATLLKYNTDRLLAGFRKDTFLRSISRPSRWTHSPCL